MGQTVSVHGRTDSRGAKDHNVALPEKRARTVEAELGDLLADVDITFEAAGHGSADPVAPDTVDGRDNPEERAKNRRVEIRFAR